MKLPQLHHCKLGFAVSCGVSAVAFEWVHGWDGGTDDSPRARCARGGLRDGAVGTKVAGGVCGPLESITGTRPGC